MVGKGFAKYMRRSPMSDAEITQALRWIQAEIEGILNGDEPLPVPASSAEHLDEVNAEQVALDFDLPAFVPAENSRLVPADELNLLTGEKR